MATLVDQSVLDYAQQQGPAAETARRMPADVSQTFADPGVFQMLVPKSLGGIQAHPQDFFDTLCAIAQANGSIGWVSMIGSTTGMLSASLPEPWAQEIYGNHSGVITTGVTAPLGKAQREGDNLRVSGRWPWGSGSQVSDYICGGCFVYDADGELEQNAQDAPQPLLVFFKASEVQIHDTWYAGGLQGTGSNDIEVEDLLVPAGRWVTLGKRAKIDAPLYQFPTFGLLALGVSAVALGIARCAIAEFTQLAKGKTPTGSTRALANRATAQSALARAQAAVDSAHALTRDHIAHAFDAAVRGERLSLEHKAKLRLAATNNAWSAIAAVDALYNNAGGSSVYSDNAIQRCFRDVHVVTQHIMVAQPTLETIGKVMFGIDPKTAL